MIAFAVFNDGFTYEDVTEYSLYPVYGEIYMILLLVLVGVWIILDALLDTWESEHAMLLTELEEQEKKSIADKGPDTGRALSGKCSKAVKLFMI